MASCSGHDDHAPASVPQTARFHWFPVATQRFGRLSTLAGFLIGATLGFGMTFRSAVLAITLGAVILEVVTVFTGIAGRREGLSTSLPARWTGFGAAGASLEQGAPPPPPPAFSACTATPSPSGCARSANGSASRWTTPATGSPDGLPCPHLPVSTARRQEGAASGPASDGSLSRPPGCRCRQTQKTVQESSAHPASTRKGKAC